jgi:hypothetical protein
VRLTEAKREAQIIFQAEKTSTNFLRLVELGRREKSQAILKERNPREDVMN